MVEVGASAPAAFFEGKKIKKMAALGSNKVGENKIMGGSSAGYKYSKEWHIDPVNGLDTNDGSELKPFQTLAKANTVANNSGVKIILHTGTYSENVNFAQQNIDIVGYNQTTSGIVNINGSLTFSSPGTSQRIKGVSMTNLNHTGVANLYVNECNVNALFTKSGTGYVEVINSDIQSSGITGAGQVAYIGGKQTNVIVNNGNALVTFNKSENLTGLIVTNAYAVGILNSNVFALTQGVNAIDITSTILGTTISNSQIRNPDFTLAKISISGLYSLGDIVFDKVNSTITGTNTGTPYWFDNIGLIDVPTINTATKVLVRNADGKVAEQLLSKVTTAITPKDYSDTDAQANISTGIASYLEIDNSSKVTDEIITFTAHGYTIGSTYYLDQATAGAVTATKPTKGIVQKLFTVVDINTIKVDIQEWEYADRAFHSTGVLAIYIDGAGNYDTAQADNIDTLATLIRVGTNNNTPMVKQGKVRFDAAHGYGTGGETLYLSDTVAGGLTTTVPTRVQYIGYVEDAKTIVIDIEATTAVSMLSDVKTLPHIQQTTIAKGASLRCFDGVSWEADTVEGFASNANTNFVTPWGFSVKMGGTTQQQAYIQNVSGVIKYIAMDDTYYRVLSGVTGNAKHVVYGLAHNDYASFWPNTSLNMSEHGDHEVLKMRWAGDQDGFAAGLYQEFEITAILGFYYTNNFFSVRRLR